MVSRYNCGQYCYTIELFHACVYSEVLGWKKEFIKLWVFHFGFLYEEYVRFFDLYECEYHIISFAQGANIPCDNIEVWAALLHAVEHDGITEGCP